MLEKQSLHKQAYERYSHDRNLKYVQSLLKYIVINMLRLLIYAESLGNIAHAKCHVDQFCKCEVSCTRCYSEDCHMSKQVLILLRQPL